MEELDQGSTLRPQGCSLLLPTFVRPEPTVSTIFVLVVPPVITPSTCDKAN
jgi:hypothetical protein